MAGANAHPAAVIGIGDRTQVAVPCSAAAQEPEHEAGLDAARPGRATFGDLAESASRLLQAPAPQLSETGLLSPGQVAAQADEFLAVLPRLLKTMNRYATDIAATAAPATVQLPDDGSPWVHAAASVRQAAQHAYQALPPEELIARPWLQRPKTSTLTRDLDAAAIAITAARDLLHTHFETTVDGTRRDRSEWAPVIGSARVRKALLAELAGWSRHIVSHATRITSASPRDGSGLTIGQRRLLAICRPLTSLVTAVDSAHGREPVTSEDLRALYRIPASMLQPRRVPNQTETLAGLRLGIAECAERVRSAAAASVADAEWSPEASPESFTQTAMHASAISGHCQILLRSLAARAAQLGAANLRRDLLTAAAMASRSRLAWLAAARAWYHFKTDAPGELSPAAQETADLARWTGRLTYANPAWALTSDAGDCRPPSRLAPDTRAFTCTLAAVHHAARTMTALATADYIQIRTAALSGRLLLPAVQVPGSGSDLSVYTRAPRSSSNALLTAYRNAGTASLKAAATISRLAEQRAAAGGQALRYPARSPGIRSARRRAASLSVIYLAEPDPPPGPIERIMYDLGVTQPGLLNKAIALDDSASQLIAEAADQTAPQRWHSAVIRPGTVTSQSAVADRVLATDHPAPDTTLNPSLRALTAGNLRTRPESPTPALHHIDPAKQPKVPVLPKAS